MADRLGFELMPWQQHVALVGGELIRDEETGFWVPAYPEVFFTVPRQSGKTTTILAWETDRCWLWESFDGKPQAVAYTAQSGSDARKKFREDQVPILRGSPFWRPGSTVRLSSDDTGVHFANGSSINIRANSMSAGHSFTIDLGVLDEIWDDQDDRREQALIPAQATRHDRQKLLASTAGTEESVLYARKQAAGRQAVLDGRTEGIAYTEFSADPKDDPEDPATHHGCMPALGHTITERTVRSALEEMRQEDGSLAEFSRAWLNIPVRSDGGAVIPEAVWLAVCGPDVKPEGTVVFGADAGVDRDYASIVAADRQGRCELVDHRAGTGWVAGRLVELAGRHNAETVVDVAGPLGGLVETLTLARRKVYGMQPREVAYAAGSFYDRVADGLVSVRSDGLFDRAVAGAQKRPMSDGFVWARRTSDTDISPLVALTLALGRSTRLRKSAYAE